MGKAKTTKRARSVPETLLAGDLGGTRTRLALRRRGERAPFAQTVVQSAAHAGLAEAVLPFLEEHDARPAAAFFGVAGPVKDGKASITNLPWKLDARLIAKRIGVPSVGLANDLVIAARGCLELRPSEMTLLTEERPAKKGLTIGVLAAGTGLGEARLVWAGERYHALPTEGGHGDFAPRSPLEVELLQFLWGRFPDHVSYERVVSGQGLGAIYDFFVAREAGGQDSPEVAARIAGGDRNAIIAELGLAREHRPAELAVDLFAKIYGAEAGNVALRELALGGVYVIGNIGSIILPARKELFLEGFLAKGRFRGLLSSVPVAIVRDPLIGLRGALALAEDLAT